MGPERAGGMLVALRTGVMVRQRCRNRPSKATGLAAWLLPLALGIQVSAAGAQSFAFESLRAPLTARQTARGGLLPSETGGAELVRSNPAWLARSEDLRVGASHRSWPSGFQEQWSGAVWSPGLGTLALEASAFHAGELPAYDAEGTPAGSFRPVELVVGAGFGAAVAHGIVAGLSGQILHLESPGEPLRGFCLGGGIGVEVGQVRLGLALRNIGPSVRGANWTYRLPAEAALGGSVPLARALDLSAAGTLDRDGAWRGGGSLRWQGPGGLALLGGLANRDDGIGSVLGANGGVEIDLRTVLFAYGYASDAEIGGTHHLTIEFLSIRRDAPETPPQWATPAIEEGGEAAAPGGRAPAPSWSVWGGMHATREGALQEVRSLELQEVSGAEVVPLPTGMLRVRVAADLSERDARGLARRINAVAAPG